VAAASLSQVHRATLKGGEVVAVKVQRPNITDLIEADLEVMHSLATLMERYLDEARLLNVVGLVKEFSTDIRKELDFKSEANNLRRFAHNFAGDPGIHVPKVYEELCTRRLLVMEYIQGINISETERLATEGYDLPLIAQRDVDILLKSALEYGFFHADPHPGNIFILPGNVICLLDFGMMGTLPSHDRDSLVKLILSIIKRDDKGLIKALLELTESRSVADAEKLEMDISNMITDYTFLPLHKPHLGDVIQQELQILRTHRLRFHTHLVWLLKAIATVENTAHRLNPDFDMIQYARPYAQRLLIGRLNPLRQAGELYSTLIDLLELVKELPYDMRDVLRKLKEGQVKIEFENVGLEPVTSTLNQVSNRIALSIVIAALVVGASLIVLSGLHPLAAGIPVIGLAGYGIAGLLSIWFLISALFQRKK